MSILTELRRRNVLRVAAAWLVFAWLTLQIVDVVSPILQLPDWVPRLLLMLLAIGFVIALLLSWIYEFTAEGLKRTDAVAVEVSIAAVTGRRLDRMVLLGLTVALLALAANRFWPRELVAPASTESIAAVTRASVDEAAAESELEPATVAAVSGVAPPFARKSVAVLAFDDLSPQHDQAWFTDGLTEEILNALARLPELQVTARTSAFSFKDSALTVPEIAVKLGVQHVVEGSVRRAGERLRVTAQLIRAADGFHLWSETYERDAAAVFAVQEEIATNVARMLDVYLDDVRREHMFASGTHNPAAFEAKLRGDEVFERAHASDFNLLWEANEWFERAIALDPAYADAYVALSDAYAHALQGDIRAPETWPAAQRTNDAFRERMLTYLDNAIAATPDPATRLATQIDREFVAGAWVRLPALIRTLDATLPPDQVVRGNWFSFSLDLFDEDALSERIERARLAISPLQPETWYRLISLSRKRGDLTQALTLAEAARAAGVEHHWVIEARIRALLALARAPEAVLEARALVARDGASQRVHLALALAVAGATDEAHTLMAQIEREDSTQELLCWVWYELGDRAKANAQAHRIDSLPLGYVQLSRLLAYAEGLPFDPAATPNFAARLKEVGVVFKAYTPLPRSVPKSP